MAMSLQRVPCLRVAARPVAGRALRPLVRCAAQKDEQENKLAAPVAAMVAASLLVSGIDAPMAEAARSGGRAGASSFSARRAQSYSPRSAPAVNNYSTTIVAAPPVYSYSPFGFGGFGFGGVRIMPVIPFPFFGGLLQFAFLMLIVSVVFNVIKGALGSGDAKSKSRDWDDL